MCALDLHERRKEPVADGEPRPQMIHEEAPIAAVQSGVLQLARHARDWAAAGGSALLRAQIYPVSQQRPTELGYLQRIGFVYALGTQILTAQPPAAEASAH